MSINTYKATATYVHPHQWGLVTFNLYLGFDVSTVRSLRVERVFTMQPPPDSRHAALGCLICLLAHRKVLVKVDDRAASVARVYLAEELFNPPEDLITEVDGQRVLEVGSYYARLYDTRFDPAAVKLMIRGGSK